MTEPLREQAKVLSDNIGILSLAVTQLDRRTNRTERIQGWVVFGLILDLLLSVAVSFVVAAQFSTNATLQGAIDREARTRQEALCPLYSLLVGSYNPNSRTEGTDRDQYNFVFDQLRSGYESLDCKLQPAPPRSDTVLPTTTAPS